MTDKDLDIQPGDEFSPRQEVILDENGDPAGVKNIGPVAAIIQAIKLLRGEVKDLSKRLDALEKEKPAPASKAKPKKDDEAK